MYLCNFLNTFRPNSMSNNIAYSSLLLVELILLVIKFVYTTIESVIRVFLPPLEKSLVDEIILVSSKYLYRHNRLLYAMIYFIKIKKKVFRYSIQLNFKIIFYKNN